MTNNQESNFEKQRKREVDELVFRLDERVNNLEKRIGRLETGVLGVLIASLYILARAVLNSSGIPLV